MAGEYIEFNNNSQPALNDTNINRLQQLIKQDIQGAVSGDTLPIGAIMPFGSDTIPENWLLCNGQAISRTTYQELFNTIGITYGSGNGFTTFNLPDLQGKIPVGLDENDTDFDTLGNTGGEKTHTHSLENGYAKVDISENNRPYWKEKSVTSYSVDKEGTNGNINKNNSSTSVNKAVELGGNTDSESNLQPYIVQNYIIKAKQSAGIVATVVDGLNSTSATNALSANQGRILNDKFNYSTEEKVVGTWIDGKPIYRKVIESTVANIESVINNLGFDVISDIRGWAVSNYDNKWLFPNYSKIDSNYSIDVYLNNDTNNINLNFGSYYNSSNTVKAIIEYTKTTD